MSFRPPFASPAHSSPRVLVVDDEPTPRMAIAEGLSLMGYQADEAASGTEALEMLAARPYELMLLDLRMPGLDGVEVMKQARTAYPNVQVIVLTAHGSLESAIEAIRAGASDYVLKPSSIRDTEAAIAQALGRPSEVPRPRRAGTSELRCGPLTLDLENNLAALDNAGSRSGPVELTSSEAALLAHLMRRPGRVFSCRELALDALAYDVPPFEAQEIVRPHISRLRRKLADVDAEGHDSRSPSQAATLSIQTVRGKGYLLSVADGC